MEGQTGFRESINGVTLALHRENRSRYRDHTDPGVVISRIRHYEHV